MNIVFLTVEERLYLPAFFHRVLQQRAGETRAIFLCPLKHGQQSTLQMIAKYRAAFGWVNLVKLARREVRARLVDALKLGRGQGRFGSLPSVAKYHGVPCETIPDVNAPAVLQRLRDMSTDLIVSVSCPQILKKPLIDLPLRGCLNVHGSLLPRYRGLSPSFWMMRNGEDRAGVTVFFVTEAIDLGHVVEQQEFPILPEETLEQFIIRSRVIHSEALLRAIEKIERGNVPTWPLTREGGSYYSFPTRADYREFRRRGRRLW